MEDLQSRMARLFGLAPGSGDDAEWRADDLSRARVDDSMVLAEEFVPRVFRDSAELIVDAGDFPGRIDSRRAGVRIKRAESAVRPATSGAA